MYTRTSSSPPAFWRVKMYYSISDSYMIGRECERDRKIFPGRPSHPFVLSTSHFSHFFSGLASQAETLFRGWQTNRRPWRCLTLERLELVHVQGQRKKGGPLATLVFSRFLIRTTVRKLHKITYELTILDFAASWFLILAIWNAIARFVGCCCVSYSIAGLLLINPPCFLQREAMSMRGAYSMRQALRTMERLNQIPRITNQ